jgi:hypothetical protein
MKHRILALVVALTLAGLTARCAGPPADIGSGPSIVAASPSTRASELRETWRGYFYAVGSGDRELEGTMTLEIARGTRCTASPPTPRPDMPFTSRWNGCRESARCPVSPGGA